MATAFEHADTALPPDFKLNNLAVATDIQPTGVDGTYTVDLKRDWCMGLVPHGGVLTAVVTAAVKTHTSLKHPSLAQPDLITLHIEFIERTMIGPASITVTMLKPGRQFSTLRVQLFQSPAPNRPASLCLEALVRQGNLAKEALNTGLSLPTNAILSPADMPARRDCVEFSDPPTLFVRRTAYAKLIILVPRLPSGAAVTGAHPVQGPSVREQWVTWRREEGYEKPGVGFDITGLCFLGDAFMPMPEAYGVWGNWYPTLNLGMEVKKAPPEGGWEWLLMRIEVKAVRNGRSDMDVAFWEEGGELVGLARHCGLIVPAERNLKKKSGSL